MVRVTLGKFLKALAISFGFVQIAAGQSASYLPIHDLEAHGAVPFLNDDFLAEMGFGSTSSDNSIAGSFWLANNYDGTKRWAGQGPAFYVRPSESSTWFYVPAFDVTLNPHPGREDVDFEVSLPGTLAGCRSGELMILVPDSYMGFPQVSGVVGSFNPEWFFDLLFGPGSRGQRPGTQVPITLEPTLWADLTPASADASDTFQLFDAYHDNQGWFDGPPRVYTKTGDTATPWNWHQTVVSPEPSNLSQTVKVPFDPNSVPNEHLVIYELHGFNDFKDKEASIVFRRINSPGRNGQIRVDPYSNIIGVGP